eukprot:1556379-Rhodomonas_salina.2
MHREIQQVSTGCCLGGHRVWVPDIAQRAQQDRENQYRAQHSVRYSTIEYLLAALCYEASHAICYRQYQAGSTVHLSVPAVAKYHTLLSQFQHTAHRLGQYRLSRSAPADPERLVHPSRTLSNSTTAGTKARFGPGEGFGEGSCSHVPMPAGDEQSLPRTSKSAKA